MEVFNEFLIMKTSCQGVYQYQREGMTWKSCGEGNTGDAGSHTAYLQQCSGTMLCGKCESE